MSNNVRSGGQPRRSRANQSFPLLFGPLNPPRYIHKRCGPFTDDYNKTTLTDKDIIEKYKSGQRHFADIDIVNGRLTDSDLSGVSFDKCYLSVDFKRTNLRRATFTTCNIKTCDFRDCDLTDTLFENVSFEGTQFKGAKTKGTIFKNNYSHSGRYHQSDFEDWIKNS